MNNYLKKIKVSFSVIILLLIVTMVSGGFVLKSNDFFTGKQLSQTVNYLNYKLSFAYANDKNLAAALISIFNDAGSTIKNTSNNTKSIPVLLYHGIINESDGFNALLENFEDQMFALKKSGWQTVSVEDFYAFAQGKKELPDKSFLLTFDDGRKDSYYPVDPILKALNYNAVSFIITKYSVGKGSGSNYYLSNNELRRMSESGRWEIEAHTREGHDTYKISPDGREGHFYSNKLWLEDRQRIETEEEFKERIYRDLASAKNELESAFGIKVNSFAYPFGDFGQNSINFPEAKDVVLETIKSVYPMSFYQVWGGNPKTNYPQPGSEHLFIKRINVEPQWSADDLLTVLENSREKTLPYQDNFIKDNGWIKDWGRMNFNDNSVVVGANASTTGGAVFLDGTYSWQNYIFKAAVHLAKGQVFSLAARYKDGKNYAACSFSNESIRAEQVLNGERKILHEWKDNFRFIGRSREVGIAVDGDVVDCYVDNQIAVREYNLDRNLDHGGIGLKTWDSQVDNSELIVKGVFVEEIE